jgi:hypothetical protein
MSKRKKMAIGVIAAVILTGCLLYVAMPFIRLLVFIGRDQAAIRRDTEQSRVRLLCETDHEALLGACREVLRQVADGKLKTGVYVGGQIAQFPEPIPSLRPDHVTVGEDGKLKIEMMYVGWSSLGVYAYREGYPDYPPPSKKGDRKLLDGLWYYDDGYLGDPDGYDKYIDNLLRRCGKRGTGTGVIHIGFLSTIKILSPGFRGHISIYKLFVDTPRMRGRTAAWHDLYGLTKRIPSTTCSTGQ